MSKSKHIEETKTDKTPISIPDIPAQLEDAQEVIQIGDSEEVLFLKKILNIQKVGGFGKHLDALINERINTLKGL